MRYLLDTNVCIRYLNGRSPQVRDRLDALVPTDVVICSVVKAELYVGAARSNSPITTLTRQQEFFAPYPSLPFDDRAAEEYGRLRSMLEQAGTPIGPTDLLIAAIGLANRLVVVTHNTREFGRVPGLVIEDWEA